MEIMSKNENLKPLHQVTCWASLEEGKILFGHTLPRRLIVHYPEFLFFITGSEYISGDKFMFMEYIKSVTSHILYANRVNNPKTMIISAVKWLMTNQNKIDIFPKALMNPNSFFIPTHTVKNLTFNKEIITFHPHITQIKLNGGSLQIYLDPILENKFKTLLEHFLDNWWKILCIRRIK